jgi:hypothetical protein
MESASTNEAFDAIHDEAVKPLGLDLPEDVEQGLQLIVSLARYRADVRTYEEAGRKPSRPPETDQS